MRLTDQDKSIGFTRASDGWHLVEITEQTGLMDDKETHEATDTFIVSVQVVNDEDEGSFGSIFCDLTKKGGRTRLARVIGFSGRDKAVEKKGMETDISAADWGEKYLSPEHPKQAGLINEIKVKLVGGNLKGEFKTSKGKDGKEYSNIINLDYAGSVGKKSGGEKAGGPGGGAVIDADTPIPEDDEAW